MIFWLHTCQSHQGEKENDVKREKEDKAKVGFYRKSQLF